jgi:two-component system, chemotaxis family, protein-glutamate methylesterase/glutaminase
VTLVQAEIRVLVIDDSAWSRQSLTTMLEATAGVRVVGRAVDGDDGLKQVFAHAPDVVTLDLDMPRMDGFTFLRILMSRRPTPVIVISSHARRDNVFRALELGALDFIAKPSGRVAADLGAIAGELAEKVRLLGRLRMVSLADRVREGAAATPAPPADPAPEPVPLRRLVVIGASTGGPSALQQLMGALDPRLPAAVVIAQHMPPRFTEAFAERLDRASRFEVREARAGDRLRSGLALVAPGAMQTTVYRAADGVRAHVEAAAPGQRFAPSIDTLFESAARAYGEGVIGVILTGMAGEGARGARAVADGGGIVLAEARETALLSGMPDEAVATGACREILPLGAIAGAILRRAGG